MVSRYALGFVVGLGLILWVVVACNSKSGSSPDGGSPIPCPANSASTSGAASTLTNDQTLQNKICYEGTSNWYVIQVPSGSTLLDVTAGYNSAADTSIQLDLKVFYKTNSTTLTQLAEVEAASTSDAGGPDSIQTTVHATQPGSYYLQLSDAHNVNFDAQNAYTLTVGYAVDPDTHEPNDTVPLAKASDGKPGWLAYLNDLDVFKTTVATAGELLTLTIANPMSASATINYQITSSTGAVLFQDVAPPQDTTLSTTLAVDAPGTYYVTLSYPAGAVPSHATSSAYTLTFASAANPDTLENHTLATAACPGGGTGPCSMAFSGSLVTLPGETSYITVPGQHDFYRVDVASGAALVLQMNLTSSASTPVKYAVDLLTADPDSPCTVDTDCAAMKEPCDYMLNDAGVSVTTQCELSHECLPPGNYSFCASPPCSLCQGASLCTPAGLCAVPQYLSAFTPSGLTQGGPTVSTAQPLFSNQPYYVSVHDVSYSHVDLTNSYTLSLVMAPEPDQYDQSTTAAQRNNFYNPYPSSFDDESPNIALAHSITGDLSMGQTVTGYISYQSDNDWFSFQHPCPGKDCALSFSFVQPGPSNVHVAFFMLNDDLSVHETFGYDGKPQDLTVPFNGTFGSFGSTSCNECSFASSTVSDGGAYTYYLRIADLTQKDWDFTAGKYSLTITKGSDGCPEACNVPKGSDPPGCYCYCADAGGCPSASF